MRGGSRKGDLGGERREDARELGGGHLALRRGNYLPLGSSRSHTTIKPANSMGPWERQRCPKTHPIVLSLGEAVGGGGPGAEEVLVLGGDLRDGDRAVGEEGGDHEHLGEGRVAGRMLA